MTEHKNKDEQSNGLFDFGESLLNVAESALKGKDVAKAIAEELPSDSSAIIENAAEIGQGVYYPKKTYLISPWWYNSGIIPETRMASK